MRTGTIYEFADFRLIPDDGLLLHDGQPVPLTPKAFSTLLLLIERHGHLVLKSELIEKVWSNAFIEEAAVSRCIWTIRNALGEDSKHQRYIQTVPKRGYKFVAPVAVVGGKTDETESAPMVNGSGALKRHSTVTAADDAPTRPDRPFPKARTAIVLTTIILFALASIAAYVTKVGPSAVTNGSPRTIAILPLKPLNLETRDVRYEVGIADALILRLSSIDGITVRSLQAVQGYVDQQKDAVDVGREQKVGYVLPSNYQIAEGKIRVTSQLLNVASGQVEDTFKLETPLTDFFSVQDSVANELGDKLIARFAASQGTIRKRGTSNEEAYRLYLQAMYLSTQRRRDSVLKSIEVFDQVVRIDPSYAQAWASKAHAHALSSMTASSIEPSEAYPKAIEAINRALALDPELSEAYSALCRVKIDYDYDLVGAEPFCERAVELDPDSSRAHQVYATLLASLGRTDESVAQMKLAVDLDPTSYENHRFYANSLYYARRFDEAVVQYKRLIDLDPNSDATYNWLIRTLEAQGKESEAFEWLIRSLSGQKTGDEAIHRFTTAYRESGWKGVLLERIREPVNGRRQANLFRVAGWYAAVGNNDKAFEYLERAYQTREGLMTSLHIEPQFDSLRDDPRYADLVKRIGLK